MVGKVELRQSKTFHDPTMKREGEAGSSKRLVALRRGEPTQCAEGDTLRRDLLEIVGAKEVEWEFERASETYAQSLEVVPCALPRTR